MTIYSFIFARGGSKGLPNKNIKKFHGLPLISYSLKISNNIREIDKCFVSTDSKKIADIAESFNAHVIKRPKELASDKSPEWKSWQHAINYCQKKFGKFDKFISLPATSPLKKESDIKKCIKLLDKKTDAVITITQSHRSPWFNMVKKNLNYLSLVNSGSKHINRRQDAPEVFDMTTICYALKPNFILENKSIWEGRVKGLHVPLHRSIDIDDMYDFKLAEFMSKELK